MASSALSVSEAHDQVRRHTETPFTVFEGTPQTCDHPPRVHAPVAVCLRVEEDFSMPHALGGSLCGRPGQLVEVPLVEPYWVPRSRGTERLQVGEA